VSLETCSALCSMAFEPRSPTFAKYGGERQPLLDYKQKPDAVVGIAGSLDIPEEADPHVAQELKTLLKLVYPVVSAVASLGGPCRSTLLAWC
jgi:hypothetical protein